MRHDIPLSFLICTVAIAFAGCASGEPVEDEPIVLMNTPLPVDPTDEITLPGWWVGRASMLRLDVEMSYALYDDTNRYHLPSQRGRWAQQNFATIRLEPYSRLPVDPVRVRVERFGDRFGLVAGGRPPMFRAEKPPAVFEDRLVGRWDGGDARLALHEDGRYEFTPSGRDGAVAGLAGHRGEWHTEGQTIVLRPDTPGIEPMRLDASGDSEHTVLEGDGGRTYRTR